MKKRLFTRIPVTIALIILFSSRLSIAQSAETHCTIYSIQLTDYPSQIEVGDLMTIKGWVTFTQSTTNYPVYAVLVIEGSKMKSSAKWLPEGTVPETSIQLGTYTYDGNIHWVWYIPEIDNGATYTIYALDRETAKIKSNTLTYNVGGSITDDKPQPPPEPFNFGITGTSSSISIQRGQSGLVDFSIMLSGGATKPVSLSLSGLPTGCTYSLDPLSGTPPFSSTLIVDVGTSTTTGSYVLTVTGTGASLARIYSLKLIVTESVPSTYSLIVTTQPSGILMWQCADSYSAGSIVHLGTAPETVEGGAGIRYIFQYWKVDGILVYDNPPTITMDKNHVGMAVYKTQYYLTVQSAQDTPSQPSGYQDANSIIPVSVRETVNVEYDSRYICKSYLLDDASHLGNNAWVTMDKPHNLTFVWTLQFYLILTCTIAGPSLVGENWYDYGATATIQAPATFLASDAKPYQFHSWVSTGDRTPDLANSYESTTTLEIDSSGYELEAQYNTIEVSYMIVVDGNTIHAINWRTGEIDYSGADASLVINSAVTALTNGGGIFLRSGTYQVSAPIALGSNITIQGEGDSTLLSMSGGINTWNNRGIFESIGTLRSHIVNVTIREVHLRGNYAGAYWGSLIKADFVDDLRILNCVLEDGYRETVSVYDSTEVKIVGNDFRRSYTEHIRFSATTNSEISLNSFSDAGEQVDSGGTVYLEYGSNYNVVSQNHIYNERGDQGICIIASDRCVVEGNVIDTVHDVGIYTKNCDYLNISGNTIRNTGTGNTYCAILCGQDAVGNDNKYCSVTGNTIETANGDGITCIGQFNVIANNTIKDASGEGISSYSSDVTNANNTLTRNTISSCGDHGIYLYNADNFVISYNRITDNGGYGIVVGSDTCDNTLVQGNYLLGNGRGALFDRGTDTVQADNVTA